MHWRNNGATTAQQWRLCVVALDHLETEIDRRQPDLASLGSCDDRFLG
jgi:hypothetical protein